jgi:hypothetical protein
MQNASAIVFDRILNIFIHVEKGCYGLMLRQNLNTLFGFIPIRIQKLLRKNWGLFRPFDAFFSVLPPISPPPSRRSQMP